MLPTALAPRWGSYLTSTLKQRELGRLAAARNSQPVEEADWGQDSLLSDFNDTSHFPVTRVSQD